MDPIVSYYGWVGHNNIGDEAIYTACNRLFDEFQLVPDEYLGDNGDLELFGGGTIWPPTNYSPSQSFSASIGVGVKQPEFYNRKFSLFDKGHYVHQLGLSRVTKRIFGRGGHYIQPQDLENLHNISHIGVRGPLSKKVLSECDIESTITGDTALILEPNEYNHDTTNTIGISLRSGGKKWTDSKEYISKLKKFCNQRSDINEVLLIPLNPSDIPLHLKLARELSSARFVNHCTVPDIDAILDLYAECDMVISERLHGNVLAACSHTPFISLEYRPKSRDFSASVEMDDFNLLIDKVSIEKLELLKDRIDTEDIISCLERNVSVKRRTLKEFSQNIINDVLNNHRKSS